MTPVAMLLRCSNCMPSLMKIIASARPFTGRTRPSLVNISYYKGNIKDFVIRTFIKRTSLVNILYCNGNINDFVSKMFVNVNYIHVNLTVSLR